jgi:hypothetical protein
MFIRTLLSFYLYYALFSLVFRYLALSDSFGRNEAKRPKIRVFQRNYTHDVAHGNRYRGSHESSALN